jgi:hypothetical protein
MKSMLFAYLLHCMSSYQCPDVGSILYFLQFEFHLLFEVNCYLNVDFLFDMIKLVNMFVMQVFMSYIYTVILMEIRLNPVMIRLKDPHLN